MPRNGGKKAVGKPVAKRRTFGEADRPIETETTGAYFLVSRCDPEGTEQPAAKVWDHAEGPGGVGRAGQRQGVLGVSP